MRGPVPGRRARSTRRGTRAAAGFRGLAVLTVSMWSLGGVLPAHAGSDVAVLYAGSLINVMQGAVGPAFDRASGDHFRGYAGGSKLLANEITAHLRRADVFLSAVPGVNARLMGARHGNWVRWYLTFARSPLVIGYNPHSRFAPLWHRRPWYVVLQTPGLRIGRTDPRLDPKGVLTLDLMRRAAAYYHIPGLARRVLGAPENSAQVFPEETLMGRLQSGELDAGFFYSTETAAAGIPSVHLPPQITPEARYTITLVRGAPHPRAAIAFIAFLLGPAGRRLMRSHGLRLERPTLTGPARAVPTALRALLRPAGPPVR
jgi:molybdate/tungstate transport system substrate-binding protein